MKTKRSIFGLKRSFDHAIGPVGVIGRPWTPPPRTGVRAGFLTHWVQFFVSLRLWPATSDDHVLMKIDAQALPGALAASCRCERHLGFDYEGGGGKFACDLHSAEFYLVRLAGFQPRVCAVLFRDSTMSF